MPWKTRNIPRVKIGIVGASRDSFEVSLVRERLGRLMKAVRETGVSAWRCPVIVENEADVAAAIESLRVKKINAAVIYLGNFGPESPVGRFIRDFQGPVMLCGAAEEGGEVLKARRGDALCGLLNCGYNIRLRRLRAFIPHVPIALPEQIALEIKHFTSVARVWLGVKRLKLFSFGPRPADFFACNAPIQLFYDLGVEVVENSELDLLSLFRRAGKKTAKIRAVVRDMKKELGGDVAYPDLLPKLAQFEVALKDFMYDNLGNGEFAVFANKCWPAFEPQFGFTPCYVNSRLAGRGIPVACEVDMYGALSEFMVQAAAESPVTILDINNTVPPEILPSDVQYSPDIFMGFHCGNTCSGCMKNFALKYHPIMNRVMENGGEPDISRGTLEGQIRPGAVTLFRLQSTPDCRASSYIAEGEILDVDPRTFGSAGVFHVPGFLRFYRHVLVEKGFPHHVAVGFEKTAGVLFDALRLLGVDNIQFPLPEGRLYETENPFGQ